MIKNSITAFYERKEEILEMCEKDKDMLLISAPTGSGKTTGMKRLVQENPGIFGKTLMVQPTKMASQSFHDEDQSSSGSIIMRTPIVVLETFYRHGSFRCDTLIIDEVHTQSVEYAAILHILLAKKLYLRIRVILMSATPDVDSFQRMFPSIRILVVPVPTPFPIDIQYRKIINTASFISHRAMLPLIEDELNNRPGHQRVLIFVYTHEQCEKLTQDLKKSTNHGVQQYMDRDRENVRSLYGGFTDEERVEWNRFLKERQRSIIIATNVAETSITIPGVSFVIDFGIRCIQVGTRIVYDFCPRSNLEQRAGRTGRTCSGVVVRMMSEEEFDSRPYQSDHDYNWDIIILRMLKYNVPIANLIPYNVRVDSILDRFIYYGILSARTYILNHPMTHFILSSPLLFKNSCRLYDFLSKKRSKTTIMLYALAIAIIDAFEVKMIRIYYYSRDTTKMNKTQYMNFLMSTFCRAKDELELMINIYLSCTLSTDPFQFAKSFSLNFRSIRQITGHLHKTVDFIAKYIGQSDIDWKNELRYCVTSTTEKDLDRKIQFILFINREAMDVIQYEFMIQSTVPIVMSASGLFFKENLYADYRNCIATPIFQTRRSTDPVNRAVLLFTIDHWDMEEEMIPMDWFAHDVVLDTQFEIVVSLFTRVPSTMPTDLPGGAMDGYWDRSHKLQQIQQNKQIFSSALTDILEDVSYRPGKKCCLESLDLLQSWITKLQSPRLFPRLILEGSESAIELESDLDRVDNDNADASQTHSYKKNETDECRPVS